MQPNNAQGIMGALSKGQAQRPQPAPSPNSASPMANLGSVEDRVAAYRGNPAPLQQRYQMSQDLLDLLALQKIKSEKESAARNLQLQMAQHQAAEGDPGAATIAQQREKEVAQLVGGVAQQDGAQKEAAMRQMMSGIANAPGAAAAAQPQAMAAGGIVGYSGEEGSLVRDRELREKLERIYGRGVDISKLPRVGVIGVEEPRPTSLFEAVVPMPGNLSKGIDYSPPERAVPVIRNPQSSSSQSRSDVPESRGQPASRTQEPAVPAQPRPAPTPTAAPTAAPRPAAPTPMPAPTPAPAAPGISSLTPPDIPKAPDPEEVRREEYKRIRGEYDFTPEERENREAGIAQLRRRLAERSDPERSRMDGIMQALLAGSRGGPRNIGALTGFAEGSIAADRQQRAEREAIEKELQAMLSTGRTERLAGVNAATTGAQGAATTATSREGNLTNAAMNRFNTQIDAITANLGRASQERIAAATNRTSLQVAEINRAATAAAAAASRSDMSEARRDQIIQRASTDIGTLTVNLRKQYTETRQELQSNLNRPGIDSKQRDVITARLANIDKEFELALDDATRPLRNFIASRTPTVTSVR
jgi:hypothetical protein